MWRHKDSWRSTPRVLNCGVYFNDGRREKTNVSNHCKSKQIASRGLLLFVYCPMKRNWIQLTRNAGTKVPRFALQTEAWDAGELPKATWTCSQSGFNFELHFVYKDIYFRVKPHSGLIHVTFPEIYIKCDAVLLTEPSRNRISRDTQPNRTWKIITCTKLREILKLTPKYMLVLWNFESFFLFLANLQSTLQIEQ
jgi:hypothetical protein